MRLTFTLLENIILGMKNQRISETKRISNASAVIFLFVGNISYF